MQSDIFAKTGNIQAQVLSATSKNWTWFCRFRPPYSIHISKVPLFGASDDHLWEFGCLSRCMCWGQRMLFAIVHQHCLSQNMVVFIYQSTTMPASSALLMILLMLVPPGFAVVILLDSGWYTPDPSGWKPFSLFVIQLPISEGPLFPIRGLEFQQVLLLCTW